MKKIAKILGLILVLSLAVCALFSCGKPAEEDPVTLWDSATYKENTSFGTGAKTVTVTVEVESNSVEFTVKTATAHVADALLEHSLIGGDMSEQYGLTVYTVNGIKADFNVDSAYWAFYVNGEYALTGASFIEIKDGDSIKIAYEKF